MQRYSALSKVFFLALVMATAVVVVSCAHSDSSNHHDAIHSSRAYQGHASDRDNNNLVQAYKDIYGTRLDDCQTCHWGQPVKDAGANVINPNPCTYCHYLIHPPTGYTDLPTDVIDTLNPFGRAYFIAGRSVKALKAIAGQDSDGDGFTNEAEILDNRYPGSDASYPGLALCPTITVSLSEIKALPKQVQFGLANTTKQQFDYYATYGGVKLIDLLDAYALGGSTLDASTNVDILSPDGFKQTFTVAEIKNVFPAHKFFTGFDVDTLGATCSFVEYPVNTYGYGYGDVITDAQWHILAYEREGQPLDPVWLDPVTNRIEGEGPFRNIIPPGSATDANNQPDRGKNADTTSCTMPEWNYVSGKDHNAGRMNKGAVIIRILPMPVGCEEFDLINGGYGLADAEQILIYGNGVQ